MQLKRVAFIIYGIMIITSQDNPLIKATSALKEKKFRKQENKFLAEGVFIVCDIPDKSVIERLFVTESALKDEKVKTLSTCVPETVTVSEKVMARLSDTVTPQGVIAVIKKPEFNGIITGQSVILDGVKDPGNAGTIIRTAAAIGYKNVLAVNSADLFCPKVVRSTMGGIFHVNAIEYDGYESLFKDIDGKAVYVLDMSGENIFSFKRNDRDFALCVGSEAQGVSQTLKEKATKTLSLPMNGSMESLNASVAAGIAMYMIKKTDF